MFELHPARCNISTKMKIHAMNYINNTTTFQEALTSSAKYLMYPSNLSGFHNTETTLRRSMSGRNFLTISYAVRHAVLPKVRIFPSKLRGT